MGFAAARATAPSVESALTPTTPISASAAAARTRLDPRRASGSCGISRLSSLATLAVSFVRMDALSQRGRAGSVSRALMRAQETAESSSYDDLFRSYRPYVVQFLRDRKKSTRCLGDLAGDMTDALAAAPADDCHQESGE